MAVELFGDFAVSTLAADITSSATTLTVADGTVFPPAVTGTSQFRLQIDTELMICTNRSGATLTVTRGAEGTTAAAHVAPVAVKHVLTAGSLGLVTIPAGGNPGNALIRGSADYAASWQTDPGLGGDFYVSGYYSLGWDHPGSFSGYSLVTGRLIMRPIIIGARRSFDRIGVQVTTAAAAGGTIRLGLYSHGAGKPNALLADSGSIASTTTGAKEAVISVTLDRGIYWIGMVAQTNACSVAGTSSSVQSGNPFASVETTPPSTSENDFFSPYHNNVTGALPSTFTLFDWLNRTPIVALRAA